jgi:hypothetical protein
VQFTDNIGIVATKPELIALLAFTSEGSENASKVSFKLCGAELLSWATNGLGACICHGRTFDGSGKPSTTEGSWQIPADTLMRVAKAAGKGDEIIFRVDKKGHIRDATIRDIESSETRMKVELQDVSTDGVLFDLEATIPTRPDRNSVAVGAITLAPSLLSLLVKVAKAAGCDSCRLWMPRTGIGHVYCEVDQPSALSDDEAPRWVCVLAPQGEAEPKESTEEEE